MATTASPTDAGRTGLAAQIKALPPNEAAALIERAQPSDAVDALLHLNPAFVQSILSEIDKGARSMSAAASLGGRDLIASASPERGCSMYCVDVSTGASLAGLARL